MPYRLTGHCIKCKNCMLECPVGAISFANGERVLDEALCVECGFCAMVCPQGALTNEK